ncbi:unnamed protein product [Bemisia tabaci]|uniref:Cystatin domain-containing protein n=1 Tax=Bemisia tabaci TaxID=7038 RepID=A0A9P0F0I9_BEMTA|nr:unnamed protein product [Bemisia tabaci]
MLRQVCSAVITLTVLHFIKAVAPDFSAWGITSAPDSDDAGSTLFLGTMVENDEIIYETVVEKRIKRNRIAAHTVEFPERRKTNKKIINFIAAVDCNHKVQGQPPEVLEGGINQTHVTILLKSFKGKSLYYVIHIRGLEPGDNPGKPRTPPTWTGPKNYTRKSKLRATTPLSTS